MVVYFYFLGENLRFEELGVVAVECGVEVGEAVGHPTNFFQA